MKRATIQGLAKSIITLGCFLVAYNVLGNASRTSQLAPAAMIGFLAVLVWVMWK